MCHAWRASNRSLPEVDKTSSRGFWVWRCCFIRTTDYCAADICAFSIFVSFCRHEAMNFRTRHRSPNSTVVCAATGKSRWCHRQYSGTCTDRDITPMTPTGCHDFPCTVVQRAMTCWVLESTGDATCINKMCQHSVTPTTPAGCHLSCREAQAGGGVCHLQN